MRYLLLALLILAWRPLEAATLRAVTEDTAFTWIVDGRVSGPATAVVERTLAVAGIDDYSLELYPWARAYDLALHEPAVLIYLIARTPAREAQFHWVGEITRLRYYFYRLASRNDVRIEQLDEARAYRLGVMRDDVRHQYLQQLGFQRLVVSGQQQDNFNRLLSGQVDALLLPERDAAHFCQAAGSACPGLQRLAVLEELDTPLYMAFSAATPAPLVERLRTAFAQLKASGEVARLLE
ncbi:ABC transporter substrate-binding protein [Pseudomonas oryzihabitans]|uniref:substrate-binding periplasmic protein n=1 Tax=Pseudomonas rhizoryzae TaxID=2571129 RepID=UPI000737554A|nr:transporter substrate-binding domain-containing protein [Pseudomonas rhizoryzae]KTS78295.1 ABC transporter substrate-binding protein [Pseudomonas psychrotolerans]KTT31919.1 ABC transporter substrate-binding protein [Pseudomonas psychrotolerans]KTT37234.1 ABC transporter substrate-binding protein [Pseudomonas psychrotolerans]KTT58365.1 ABC transporter substrate-binding protein [Pseudomonas psychrotolerans]KTT64448.1 ABC transporter substrate-binding protein [Pseudomonas psychrotolerans]